MSLLLSLVVACVLTHHEYGGRRVWDPRHHFQAFWRYRGPNSMKYWWRRVPAWKPHWNAHEGSFVLRFYGWVVMLCLALVGYRQRMLYCRRAYRSRVKHVARAAAVTSQLCVTVLSCCSGSMVGLLVYCLGWAVGYEYLHVTVRWLATVGSPQSIAHRIYNNITWDFFVNVQSQPPYYLLSPNRTQIHFKSPIPAFLEWIMCISLQML